MGLKNLSDEDAPEKPIAHAGIPQEVAHMQGRDGKSATDAVKEEKEDILDEPPDSPNTPGSSGRTSPADRDGDFQITEAMLQEEEELRKKGKMEEKKLEKESKESFEKELMEQRYKRLQHLLQKSSIYANFLLLKMEQQKQQEEKKWEKLNRSKESEERTDSQEEETKSQSSEDQNSDSQGTSTGSQGGRRSRRLGKKSSPKAALKESTKQAKSSKRKRVTESYSIREYVDTEALKAKKLKPNSPVGDEPSKGEASDEENEALKAKKLEPNSPVGAKSPNGVTSGLENESLKAKKLEPNSPVGAKSPKGETSDEENEVPEDDSFSRIINGERVSDKQPSSFSGGVLRPYQVEGFEWLKVLYENGVNGILADEMGLGKTIQVIALFSHIIEMGVPGPFLVCAPLSTLPNWMSEFTRFSPDVPSILYHGAIHERADLRRKIKQHLGKYKVQPVVITSYEIVMRDRKFLEHYLWKYVVVDEGHRIKNLNCRLIQELKMYKTANRLLLTGTPLQNNLSELWSMLNFLLPEVFDDLRTFESWFDFTSLSKEGGDEEILKEEREKNILSMLHQILSPFLLRRLKKDVDLSIPQKKEIMVHAPLSAIQEEYYRNTVNKTILEKLNQKEEKVAEIPIEFTPAGRPKRRSRANIDYSKFIIDTDKESEEDILAWANTFCCVGPTSAIITQNKQQVKKNETNIRLLNIVMQLRKCCNHPYLLSYPLDPVTQEYRVDEELITSSGKLMVMERLLPALKKNKHKVLIFSQMTSLLDILHDYCILRKYNFCRLDGKMPFLERQEQMTKFRTDPNSFLFLLSTRAGGLGINLTTADTVIIFDSDWNPQSDLQAMDRCHRIGQTKPVVVYRLVTAGTIDQKIVERAAAKRKLEKMIIHQGKFKGGAKNLKNDFKSVINPEDLLQLLRSHDYSDVVNTSNGKVISDSDLKILLDRSDLMAQGSSKKKKPKIQIKSKVFEILENDEGSKGVLG